MGGLSKKAFQFDSILSENQRPAVIVDAGALLFEKELLTPGTREQAMATAEGIVKAYNLMGYDAVGIARQDLAAGLGFLKDLRTRSEFAWLSANLVAGDTGRPIFQPSVILNKGALKVGITALTGEAGPLTLAKEDNAVILPWRDALEPVIRELNEQCDLIILLSNQPREQNRQIATRFANIHLLIQAGINTVNLEPELLNNTLIAQTGKQGKYLGWLTTDWQPSRTWGDAALIEKLTAKKNELDGIEWRLERYEKQMSAGEHRTHELYAKLKQQGLQLAAEVAELREAAERMQAGGALPSSHTNRFIAMEISLPDDQEVLAVVEATKQRVNAIGKETPTRQPGGAPPPEEPGPESPLAGWRKCAPCHEAQTASWQSSGHAKAYRTLTETDQNFNLDCLPCHVTFDPELLAPAEGIEGALLHLPAALQAVGCEVCHGPGQQHAAAPGENRMIVRPAESICRRCHTTEQSPAFDYRKKLETIDHGGGER